MPDCECLAACPFFNDRMAGMPATSDRYKRKYCKGDFGECARYMVYKAKGKGAVPATMFPNMQVQAEIILKS